MKIFKLLLLFIIFSFSTIINAASFPVVRDLNGDTVRSAKIIKSHQRLDLSLTNKAFVLDFNGYRTNGSVIIAINNGISWHGNIPPTKLIYFSSRVSSVPVDNNFFINNKTPPVKTQFITSAQTSEKIIFEKISNTDNPIKVDQLANPPVSDDKQNVSSTFLPPLTVETQRSYISLQSNALDTSLPESSSPIRESSIEIMKTTHLDTIRLPNVLFKKNQSDLGSKSLNAILKTRYLFSQSYSHIIIKGHTDSSGKPDYNRQLSEKRAMTVQNLIIKEFKVPPDKIEIQGLADTEPEADNATEKGREMNRRVTIGIIRE